MVIHNISERNNGNFHYLEYMFTKTMKTIVNYWGLIQNSLPLWFIEKFLQYQGFFF